MAHTGTMTPLPTSPLPNADLKKVLCNVGKYCTVMDIGKPSEPTKRIFRVLIPSQVSGLIMDSNSDESNTDTVNVVGQ
jgi:hypothetical protein